MVLLGFSFLLFATFSVVEIEDNSALKTVWSAQLAFLKVKIFSQVLLYH